MEKYDCIVVGAGHAGIEAANIAAKLGSSVLLLTIDIEAIGKLSCNPAVGGVAKGHLVREVDALGGLIAEITDQSSLGYRILNRSKGKAVWATRAQVDMYSYPKVARNYLASNKNITILQAKAEELLIKDKKICGVRNDSGQIFKAKTVIIASGTFLKSKIHIGMDSFSGGRLNEPSSDGLFLSIKKAGLKTKHFKTGTPARLDKRTIDFSKMQEQVPDSDALAFSFRNKTIRDVNLSCFITHTNKKTHKIILNNLKFSPLYTGKIKSTGVRYCPSIEDKVVRFSDRDQHHVFIEPQGQDSLEIYPNGISTSLPYEVQLKMIHSISGLENAKVLQPGYGIEHGVIDSRQLYPWLETKTIKGLFFAGQVNGTTGYEEAASLGLIAGINAGLLIKRKKPFILPRDKAYIGVLIDDLTKKGTDEPYRMFTSRSEFRLSLRETNADLRLGSLAYKLSLLSKAEYELILNKKKSIENGLIKLKNLKINYQNKTITAYQLLKRPGLDLDSLKKKIDIEDLGVKREIEILSKYEGFLKREKIWAREMNNLDRIKLPKIDFSKIPSLSSEIVEKLKKFKPQSLGEALGISGVTPAAILAIYNFLRSRKLKNKKS